MLRIVALIVNVLWLLGAWAVAATMGGDGSRALTAVFSAPALLAVAALVRGGDGEAEVRHYMKRTLQLKRELAAMKRAGRTADR